MSCILMPARASRPNVKRFKRRSAARGSRPQHFAAPAGAAFALYWLTMADRTGDQGRGLPAMAVAAPQQSLQSGTRGKQSRAARLVSSRMTSRTARTNLIASARSALAWGCMALASAALAAPPAAAQGWNWPWDTPQQQKPVPREPVYRPQQPNNPSQWTPPPGPPPPGQSGPAQAPQPGAQSYSAKSNICIQLEQRLVQEGQRGNQSRDLMPMVETEINQVEQQARAAQQQLDRSDCYEFFLFTKNLRSTRKCKELASAADQTKRRLADLDVQRQQLQSSSGRSYADDIVRELQRNNCPGNYSQQASRREGGNGSIWQEEGGAGGGGLGSYNSVPYATYRTLCVRQCDGYYFPISFSTLPNHFERDAELCQSKCAAPVDLYYYQNPGGAVDQMLGYRTNEPYKSMKSAFRYRKEFVAGCSCKQTEFVPDPNATVQSGSAAPPVTTGTTARESATGPQTSGWSTTDPAPQ
jgi:Protein of unknown function (DUF2865)